MKRDEKWYNENAKKGCRECEGKGMISYQNDDFGFNPAPCHVCFPNDSWAIQANVAWRRKMRDVELSD